MTDTLTRSQPTDEAFIASDSFDQDSTPEIEEVESLFTEELIRERLRLMRGEGRVISPDLEHVDTIEGDELDAVKALIPDTEYERTVDGRFTTTADAEEYRNQYDGVLNEALAPVLRRMDADFRERMQVPDSRSLYPAIFVRTGNYENKKMPAAHVDNPNILKKADDPSLVYIFSVGKGTAHWVGELQVPQEPDGKFKTDDYIYRQVDPTDLPSAESGDINCMDLSTVHSEPVVDSAEPRLFMRVEYKLDQNRADYVPPAPNMDFV